MAFRWSHPRNIVAATLALSTPVHAAITGGDGRQLSASCASCHGSAGGLGAIPVIAGMDKTRIVQTMLGFRAGTRQGPIMHIVASALSPAEIVTLAQYLAAQPDPSQQQNAGAPR